MTMITPSYLGETIEYSSLHACRSTLEDPNPIDENGLFSDTPAPAAAGSYLNEPSTPNAGSNTSTARPDYQLPMADQPPTPTPSASAPGAMGSSEAAQVTALARIISSSAASSSSIVASNNNSIGVGAAVDGSAGPSIPPSINADPSTMFVDAGFSTTDGGPSGPSFTDSTTLIGAAQPGNIGPGTSSATIGPIFVGAFSPSPAPGPHANGFMMAAGPRSFAPPADTPPAAPQFSTIIASSSAAPSVGVGLQSEPGTSNNFFRISRLPAGGSELEVHYTFSGYGSGGVVREAGATVIGAQASHVDVSSDLALPAESGAAAEIVMLTLQDRPDYQIGTRSVTLFTTADSGGLSEAALLEAYRDGQSPEAFRALVERYRAVVMQTCQRLLGNSHDAEDVMQMVFLALAQRQVRLQTTLAGWLRTVARNTAIMVLRSRSRRSRHERQAARPDLYVAEETTQDLAEELETALHQVPTTFQEAVRLRYLEGRSQQEAAGLVGVPRGTLSQRAAQGIRCLRKVLAQRGTVAGMP